MTKRPSLFKEVQPAATHDEDAAPSIANDETAAEKPTRKSPSKRPPSREGKRMLSVYLDPLAWKQLRMLALETDKTTQALGEEAINLLFAQHRINRSA
jgi:hypothetical protein